MSKSLAFDDSLGGLFVGDVKTFTPISEIWKASVQLEELQEINAGFVAAKLVEKEEVGHGRGGSQEGTGGR